MKGPPKEIWLQFYGDGERDPDADINVHDSEVTWCTEKVFDSDFRYVLDKRQVKKDRKIVRVK